MLFFRSEEQVRRWCEAHGYPLRPLVRIDQLWKLRLSTFPSEELDHLRYVCMVDDSRARTEMGYEPVYSVNRVLKDVRRLRYRVS